MTPALTQDDASGEADSKSYHGHVTMTDGSHRALSKDEAAAIWKAAEAAKGKRAADMPTTLAALVALHTARERLRELGWSEAQYCPKNGADFAIVEYGSTGIFHGNYHGEWPDGRLCYCDGSTHPHGAMFKPLDALTDDERAHLKECTERERQLADREAAAFARSQPEENE